MGGAALADRPVVLIVEDEPLIRWSAEAALTGAGFDLLSAANADEALALLTSHDHIRVVFSDINMPGSQDGAALVRVTRARWPAIGIVLTSGHDRRLPACLGDRALFISKPYRDGELIEAIRSVLD